MNNADTPASPTQYQDSDLGELHCDNLGLTKREHFAAMAMQGFLTGTISAGNAMEFVDAAAVGVRCADALLKELEK